MRHAVLTAGTLVVSAAAASPAGAAWAPGATPASAAGTVLGDDRSAAPLVSADGRYVVFSTSASVLLGDPPQPEERYAAGLVRKDLRTGDVDVVAPPQRVLRDDPDTTRGTGTAGTPAGISADGRYVLFGTRARLGAADTAQTSPDVYVRDMTRPASGQASYELVSARDGSAVGAEYVDPTVGSVPGAAGYALSADGRRAAFVSEGASDLPARELPDTPAQQVWVRDLDARTTTLVSRDRADGSRAGRPAPQPTGNGATPPTAALSADGSTVAWTAGDAERQTRTLPSEGPLGRQPTLLWRRLDAPTAPGRRVAGGADLDDPTCDPAAFDPTFTGTGPCYGPFQTSEGIDQTPAGGLPSTFSSLRFLGLSADGRTVLFSSAAFARPYEPLAFRGSTGYVADMGDGVSRKAGVRVAWSSPNVQGRYAIENGRLAADGRHATFASRDNRFDGLQAVGSFPTGNLLTVNVFVADLADRTVELVTRAHDGGSYETESQAGTSSGPASLSADGATVAFPASDGNLFLGDANGVDDVLVARRATADGAGEGHPAPPVAPAPPVDGTPPRALPSRFVVTLGRVAVSRRTGTATVRVAVPTGGTLEATARGTATRVVRHRGRRRTTAATVTVGRARRTPKRAGTVVVTVKVGAAAKRALRRAPHRLAVRLTLRFRPEGAPATTATRGYALRRADVTATRRSARPTVRAAPSTDRSARWAVRPAASADRSAGPAARTAARTVRPARPESR